MGEKTLKYRFTQLTEDRGSWWVAKISNHRIKLFCFFSTLLSRFFAFIKGVQLGKGIHFYGLPYFNRFPKSTIQLGRNCTLRSSPTSNQLGNYHQCIITTRFKDAIVIIGDNCGMSGISIGAAKKIIIGNDVLFGANTIITDNDWHEDRLNSSPSPVIIHDHVWIGLNCVILKGVEIGKNSIIGANSLVVSDIPENVIAGGNPCKVLKKLN